MQYQIGKVLSAIFLLLFCISVSIAHAQTSQQTLTQYISDLQKKPTDYALREKIIKYAQTMRLAPAIPTEVARHEGAAEYAFKSAKNESDYLDAAKEYEKALLIAPWLAIDYFNCGVAYEKAGQFKNAIAQFNFYLMAAPDAQDANAVRKRIGGLEYAAGKAARESSPAAIAAKKQNTFEDLLRKIDGRRYTCSVGNGYTVVFDVRGKVLIHAVILPNGTYDKRESYEILGREFTSSRVGFWPRLPNVPYPVEYSFIISEDGDRVTHRWRMNDGVIGERIHLWQR